MQISPHVYQMHIDDDSVHHPGGSNSFFVGDPGDEMVLIDAGDVQRQWTRAILDYHRQLGSPTVASVLITHGHMDHVGGLDRVQEALGARVLCHPRLAGTLKKMHGDEVVTSLKNGERIGAGGGVSLRAIFTPGHEIDHVCYYLPGEKVLFTGDTVLGASSSTVRDLKSYMRSLGLLARLGHRTICPAHGPVVPQPRGRRLVQTYISHRQDREEQIKNALSEGLDTAEDIARAIYPKNLRKGLWAAAEGNVRAHLDKLSQEGEVEVTGARYLLTG